jgi:hypothetical protein
MSPRRLRRLLATELALLPSRCQLPIPVAVNLRLASGQHILWRDVADGTVQADVAVMLDVACTRRSASSSESVFPGGCTRALATCASARFSGSIGDSRAKFGHASFQRFE